MSKSTKRPVEVLDRREVEALLKKCSNRCPTGVRNQALIAVLYWAQLRVTEALELYPRDLDRRECMISVRHGKGDKRRSAGMGRMAWGLIERWLLERQKFGANGRHPLFCTLKRGRMSRIYVAALLPRLARKAGIEKRVHAHGLRHSGAFELRRAGVDIGTISAQLGHSNIATTHRYINHIAPLAVVAAVRDMDWGPELDV